MRIILTGIICLVATILLSAQSVSWPLNRTYSSVTEQELSLIKEHYKELTEANKAIVSELKEERKNHQDFVECLYRWISALVVVFITILGALGLKTIKDAKEEVKGQIHQKISFETNDMIEHFANELKITPDALKEAIKSKSIEIKLKKDYPILLLYKTAEEDNAAKMKEVLLGFDFYNVQDVKRDPMLLPGLNKNNIIVVFSDIDIGTEQELKKKIIESKCTLFGYGESKVVKRDNLKDFVSDENKDCIGFCNSFAALHENLISLLYYKRKINRTLLKGV